MKKAPFAPVVRKIEFAYNEQVVASGTGSAICWLVWNGFNGPDVGNCTTDGVVYDNVR